MLGSRHISHDGYVLDFGDVKKVVKVICKRLNERFLCPTESDVVDMEIVDAENNTNDDESKTKNVVMLTEDGSKFVMPLDDCIMLPIVHATVEELAVYMWGEIIQALDSGYLLRRGIHTMEVIVAEAPGQEAVFRYEIPEEAFRFDVPSFIRGGDVQIEPQPCLEKVKNHKVDSSKSQSGELSNLSALTGQLEQLASALNEKPRSGDITADNLRSMMESNK